MAVGVLLCGVCVNNNQRNLRDITKPVSAADRRCNVFEQLFNNDAGPVVNLLQSKLLCVRSLNKKMS